MASKLFMYVSQWVFKLGEPGLSLYTFNPENCELKFLKKVNNNLSLGCSKVDQQKQVLYLCNECDLFQEVPYNTGRVNAYLIHRETSELTLLSRKKTYSPFTSYLNTSPDGTYLMFSNHSMNNFTTTVERDADGGIRPVLHHHDSLVNLFRLNEDCNIGDMVDFAKHTASEELRFSLLGKPVIPHPHTVMRSPSGELYTCCDKGDGHLYLYAIKDGELKLMSRTLTDTESSEPRHCAFHPTLPYLFINHEHIPDGQITLTTFRYDEDGHMERLLFSTQM